MVKAVKKNKKIKGSVMITGGTGFIGSHLIEELSECADKIYVPYIEINPQSYFAVNNLRKKVLLTKLDLRDRGKVFSYIQKNNIEFIFHLAAQTIVSSAFKNPYSTIENNIISTLNILETTRLLKSIKGVIVASSDKAYGKTKKSYTENFPLKGDHPYDVSKSAKDLITQAYYKTFNTPVVITRFGNVYGEGDLHQSRIIPGLCIAISKNIKLDIRSDGKYIRDYIYVKDVVKGYLLLMEKFDEIVGEAYNFSSKDTMSVLDLISQSERILKIKIPFKILNNAKNEIPYQHLNDSKIRKLGWKPQSTFEEKLPQILEWYKQIV